MFKADDYRLKIQSMREVLKEAEYALDIEHLRPRLAELEKEQESPDVWQDLEKSTKIGREIAGIRNKITAYDAGDTALKDAEEKVEQSAIKRGISRSSIVQEQIKGLGVEKIKDLFQIDRTLASELKDNSDKISELESDYLTAVNKLNVEKALEISDKIQDLTEKQNKKIEDVLKYNNTVKRQLAEMEEKGNSPLVGEKAREIKRQMLDEALNYYMALPKEEALKEFDEDEEVQLLLGELKTMVRRYIKGGN